jgi:hypothetical protein
MAFQAGTLIRDGYHECYLLYNYAMDIAI